MAPVPAMARALPLFLAALWFTSSTSTGACTREYHVLVTGGAGLIGSHLVRKLRREHPDYKITVLDNFFTGSRDNLAGVRVNIVERDVEVPYYPAHRVDEIYHLACPASPKHYQLDPVRTIRTNVLGTTNMLELAKRDDARIVFASTSEVYGDPDEYHHPQDESYRGNVSTIGIRACYDEGKRVGETLCFDYHRQYNVSIGVARIFNTFGSRMSVDDGRVVSNFILQALQHKKITIYGSGEQTRSFAYVSDTVDGLYRLMNHRSFTGPVNIGNPAELSMLQLAKKIVAFTNSRSELEFLPLPKDDPRQRRPNISLALRELNWKPVVSMRLGLQRTVAYFKDVLRKRSSKQTLNP